MIVKDQIIYEGGEEYTATHTKRIRLAKAYLLYFASSFQKTPNKISIGNISSVQILKKGIIIYLKTALKTNSKLDFNEKLEIKTRSYNDALKWAAVINWVKQLH